MRTGNLRYKLLRPTTETVASANTITINSGSVKLTGTTNVRGINGGVPGQILSLTSTSNGLLIANLGGGNIRLQNADNSNDSCTLNANDSIQLVYDGTNWIEVGRKSTPGPQGLQGNQGVQGFQGFDGAMGNQGPQGMPGPQGDIGPTGLAGTAGNGGGTGPQGFVGLPGAQGAQGPDGAQGTNG